VRCSAMFCRERKFATVFFIRLPKALKIRPVGPHATRKKQIIYAFAYFGSRVEIRSICGWPRVITGEK
jgi:hypothetical protein